MHSLDSTGIAFWESAYAKAGSDGLWGQKHVPYMETLAARVVAAHAVTLLDAPCGEGRNLRYLCQSVPIVVGCDSSGTALTTLKRQLTLDRTRNCLLMTGNVFCLPFPDEQFDVVLSWDLLGHLKQPEKAVHELARVCRTGGLVVGSLFASDDSTRGIGMTALGDDEYMYNGDCYFRFYSETAVRAMLSTALQGELDITLVTWMEGPHPGYRDYRHQHQSWVFTFVK